MSLSRVIKSFLTNNLDTEKKTIGLKKVFDEQLMVDSDYLNHETTIEMKVKLADEELQEAQKQAETIRHQAQLEYEQLQAKIEEEMLIHQNKVEELYQATKENGYQEGYQKGYQEGQRQCEEFIREAQDIVNASRNDYFHKLEEAEPLIVQLAVKVAEKIVLNLLETDAENWFSIVKAVIAEVREQDYVKLYVHPNWYDYTLTRKEELQLLLPNCDQLYIYPDIHLKDHGCQIETQYGKIDASLDSQLTEIKEALLEKLKEMGGNESY